MTRKHYVAIADAFATEVALIDHTRDEHYEQEMQLLLVLAQRIANVCAADNGNFDRSRFLRACGVQA